MRTPFSSTQALSSGASTYANQRGRVRQMLRDVREHQLRMLSQPTHSTELASLMHTGATAASAHAFNDPHTAPSPVNSMHQAGGGAADKHDLGHSLGQLDGKEVLVLLAGLVGFVVAFVVIGRCVDTALGAVPSESAEDVKSHSSRAQDDTTMLVTKTAVQIVLNIALLVVPYLVLSKYAPTAPIYQYYSIVAALWVVSLHAQPQLRSRLARVVDTLTGQPDKSAAEQRKRDRQLVAAHTAAAKAKQRRADADAQARKQNPHLHHLQTVHTPATATSNGALPPQPSHTSPASAPPPAAAPSHMAMNSVRQPATHPSPEREPTSASLQEPHIFPAGSSMLSSSFDLSEPLASASVSVSASAEPHSFGTSELLGPSGATFASSMIGDDTQTELAIANGFGTGAKETYINDLLR